MALGSDAMRSPFAQTVCVVQNPFPSVLWYASSGQTAHAGALLVSEKLPAAHGAHRAGDGSWAMATNVPGVHGCVASQNGWPGLSWNVLAGHAEHKPALVVLEKLPAAHGAHRSGDGSLALATNVPGVHGCVGTQND